jgi:outer membrane protein OmpA-like peptidoglycan-associated protein
MSRLENSGNTFREELISRNLYTPNDIYDIDNPKIIQALNSISRLLRPGNAFDFSNTVIGRVIGPQTPITEIGRKALFNLYTEQVKSTIIRKNAPLINFDNLLRNDKEFISKNIDYSITKENSRDIESKLFSLLRYSGVNRLSNPLVESNSKYLIKNTGKAQIQILEKTLSNNIFSNNFNNDGNALLQINNTSYKRALIDQKIKGTSILSDNIIITSQFIRGRDGDFISTNISESSIRKYFENRYSTPFYGTEDGINKLNFSRIKEIFGTTENTFNDTNEDIVTLNNNTFTWGRTNNSVSNSKGILGYTNALFNAFNTENKPYFLNKTVTSIEVNGKRHYNGIKYGITDDNGNITESRSYSIDNQMDNISKTIKPFGYTDQKRKNSPLFNRPIPSIKFNEFNESTNSVTNNVMFSIENLAIDSIEVIIDNQKGPNGGRILWFAPMLENINETVSPNINTTNFLGRGEPVYTYSNTERKLTVNFFMIVDHVEELVGGMGDRKLTFNEFQRRIYNLEKRDNTSKQSKKIIIDDESRLKKIKEELFNQLKEKTELIIPFNTDVFDDINIYFKNNTSIIDIEYQESVNNSNFEQNIISFVNKLNQYYQINQNAIFKFTIIGYTSALGSENYNQKLSQDRAENLKNYLMNYIMNNNSQLYDKININIEIIGKGETEAVGSGDFFENANSIDHELSKKDRKATIKNISLEPGTEILRKDDIILNDEKFSIEDLRKESEDLENTEEKTKPLDIDGANDNYETEFNTLENNSFSKIKEYRYQNGVTVYTPYALYERLTFLHQCTRQGRTLDNENNFSNAVFGRPPIIVFRLGDMYNTKAIITSLIIDFENTLPWDLNPEGFGVQKMGCRVSLSMNLIGGSTVDGPTKHILNGESKRFYANSSFDIKGDKLDREEI